MRETPAARLAARQITNAFELLIAEFMTLSGAWGREDVDRFTDEMLDLALHAARSAVESAYRKTLEAMGRRHADRNIDKAMRNPKIKAPKNPKNK